jgi:hypothetical protein
MVDVLNLKDRLTLKQAAHCLKKHLATIYRYIDRGIAGEKLATAWLGNVQYTSRSAIRDWSERVSKAKAKERTPANRSARELASVNRKAARVLEKRFAV